MSTKFSIQQIMFTVYTYKNLIKIVKLKYIISKLSANSIPVYSIGKWSTPNNASGMAYTFQAYIKFKN